MELALLLLAGECENPALEIIIFFPFLSYFFFLFLYLEVLTSTFGHSKKDKDGH